METATQTCRDEVEKAKQNVVTTKMAADDKQLHLGTREAKIESLKQKLNACDSNKEYQLLTDAIAADQQANSVLSDEILEMLERIDQLENELAEENKELEKAIAEMEAVKKRVAESGTQFKAELSEICA